MRKERLTILLTPKEKRGVIAAAARSGVSAGEWVRQSILPGAARPAAPTREEIRALKGRAESALAGLARANEKLDSAFAEIAATKRHFARRRRPRP